MTRTLLNAVENHPFWQRIIEVPEIRRASVYAPYSRVPCSSSVPKLHRLIARNRSNYESACPWDIYSLKLANEMLDES